MSLPKEYMNDPSVLSAFSALCDAIETSLRLRGGAMKALLVTVHSAHALDAYAYSGCECPGCKATLLEGALRGCGVDPSAIKFPTPDAGDGPIKAVH